MGCLCHKKRKKLNKINIDQINLKNTKINNIFTPNSNNNQNIK